jgi:cytochrome P450
MAEPEDIAGAAVFLSSALARRITGQAIVVDGGTSTRFPYSLVKLAGGNVFDPFSPMPTAERHAALAALRRRTPVARLAAGPWLASDMASVLAGLRAVDHFAGSFGATGSGPEEDQVMAAIPSRGHGKIRKVFNSALAYHHASRAEPFARAIATQRLDAACAVSRRDGEVEAVEHWLAPVPSA